MQAFLPFVIPNNSISSKYIHFCMNGKIRQATPTSGTTLCCQGNDAIKVVARIDCHIEEDSVFFFQAS